MSQSIRTDSPGRIDALEATLVQWFGRLSSSPAPEHLVYMVDQLELAARQSSAMSQPAEL